MTAPARPLLPLRPALAVLALLAVVSCAGPDRRDDAQGGGPSPSAPPCKVSHKTEPITARFPSFGALRSTSWCGYALGGGHQGRDLAPGPTDVRLVGLLEAVDAESVRATVDDPTLHFTPSAPPTDLPAEIAALLPAGADWRVSKQVDARLTREFYPGTFFHDRRSGLVLFDCVNPPHASDLPSAAPGH
ncbi:hypothetical protein ACGFMM_23195 [Streptomyces sp. NPDC048604]|uniref:hypothetical protein n=1 Tax=Streptomyces sp. NPDC048604 TaxID=3365578 RepID=UPI00371C863D